MRGRPLLVLLVFLTGQFLPLPPPLPRSGGEHLPGTPETEGWHCLTRAAATLELYGTFHAMGVVVTIAATDDPDSDAAAVVEYRTGGEPYRIGLPPSRVSNTRFVGSLFWLDPGTTYDVRVTFSDPGGDPLDGVTVTGAASTHDEIAIPPPSNSYYVSPGGSATYTIGVEPIGGFTHSVALTAATPSPSVTLGLVPTVVTPSHQAALTLTDMHTSTTLLSGLWYTIPITATGGGVTQTASVGLLVGGARVYLPLTLRSTP